MTGRRTCAWSLLAVGSAMLSLAAGCVTERNEPARPSDRSRASGRAGDTLGSNSSTPVLDRVASPAVKAESTLTRVIVAVKPIGSIPYDGMVLPIVSPDGRFAATQVGSPPPWPALLGESGATPESVHTRIEIYDLTHEPPTLVIVPEPLPEGLLLGRGLSDAGFLVERPNEDGSRWIGRVSWTGELNWLVGGDGEADADVSTHGTILPTGELVYVRGGQLRMRPLDRAGRRVGDESTLNKPGTRFVMPLATNDPGVVYALAEVGGGLGQDGQPQPGALELFAITVRNSTLTPHRVLGMDFARTTLSSAFRMLDAYQAAGASAPALPSRLQSNSSQIDVRGGTVQLNIQEPLAIFGTIGPRVRLYDPSTGKLRSLPQGSYAAARWHENDADGWLIAVAGKDAGGTGDPGIIFEPAETPSGGSMPGDAGVRPRVVAGSMVPRRTLNPDRPIVLLGALAGDPSRLAMTLLKPAKAPDAGN